MNLQRDSFIISLALHCAFILAIYYLSASFAHPTKPVRIDFTLIEPSGPPSAKPAGPSSRLPEPSPLKAPPKQAENRQRLIAIAATEPPLRTHAPQKTAAEPAGTVPVAVPPREATSSQILAKTGVGEAGGAGGSGQSTAARAGGGSGGGRGSGNGSGEFGTEQLRSRYRKEQFEYIRKIIQEHVDYPSRAHRNGWQGRVVVLFSVMENGKVKDIRIRKSSGYEILDENVIDTIRKVEPFPKPPIAVEVLIPISYNL